MGGLCGAGLCDISTLQQPYVHGYGSARSSGTGTQRHVSAWDHLQSLSSDEVMGKTAQLDLELRMLKDDNYRIREELSRRARGRPPQRIEGSDANPHVDPEQQLSYMKEMIRSLQAENARLRSPQLQDARGDDGGGERVSEEKHRRLQQELARLQQSHLQQLQEARQLQAASALTSAVPSGAPSAAPSGRATPVSTLGRMVLRGGNTPEESQALRAQYEALVREQEALRAKVRKLAHHQS